MQNNMCNPMQTCCDTLTCFASLRSKICETGRTTSVSIYKKSQNDQYTRREGFAIVWLTLVPRMSALRGACGVSLAGLSCVSKHFFLDSDTTTARLPSAPRKASRALPLVPLFASAMILMPVSAFAAASLLRCCKIVPSLEARLLQKTLWC